MGIVDGSLAPGPRGQYPRKIQFIEKPGVQDEGGRHVAKRSFDPRVAYTGVKVQVRALVRIVNIFDPFATRGGGSIPGVNSFHRASGGKSAQETWPGAPSTGEAVKIQGRD